CVGVARAEVPPGDPTAPQRAQAIAGVTVTIVGVVQSDPAPTATGYRVLIDPQTITSVGSTSTRPRPSLKPKVPAGASIRPAGAIMVEARSGTQPLQGDQVTVKGALAVPHGSPTFNWPGYLASQGAYLQITVGSVRILQPAQGLGGVTTLPSRLRSVFATAIGRLLPEPQAALLVGIVLGVRKGVPAVIEQALVATGLVHLLVLSGLKVALFGRLVTGALRPLLGRSSLWPALALIGLYCIAGGATPAAVRACGMGALALFAGHLGRQTHVWTSLLLLGAIMLAWSPPLALDIGFQLSFVGTAAIVLFTPMLDRKLAWLPNVVREPFTVTCAAQIGTAPLLASGFGVLSPVSPIANALVLPLLPLCIGGGLLLAPLAALPAIGQILALPLVAITQFLQQVATVLARVPGAALPTTSLPPWVGGAYYLAVGAGLVAVHTERTPRRAAIAVAVLGPLLVTFVEVGIWTHPSPAATVLAVGAGQAVLLRGPSGVVLVDGGPQPATLASELGQHLPPWQHQLDALVLTGGSSGHVGGLSHLPFTVGQVFAPEGGLTGSAWEPAVTSAAAEGAPISTLHAGMAVQVAGLQLQALAPDAGVPRGTGQLALRVVGPAHTFCDLAELDASGQEEAAGWLRGGCDAVLVPNQGKALPDLTLLAKANPQKLLISDAPNIRLGAGFPPAKVERTSQQGDLEVPL
ncbi:MAG: ComEC/Rec2 family competence protein, partial [Candidatus Dormiibacterota bacterium]